jgi:hypothetical protein
MRSCTAVRERVCLRAQLQERTGAGDGRWSCVCKGHTPPTSRPCPVRHMFTCSFCDDCVASCSRVRSAFMLSSPPGSFRPQGLPSSADTKLLATLPLPQSQGELNRCHESLFPHYVNVMHHDIMTKVGVACSSRARAASPCNAPKPFMHLHVSAYIHLQE